MSAITLLITALIVLNIFPVWDKFYRACSKVEIGMSKEKIISTMSEFVDDDKTKVFTGREGSLPYTPSIEFEESLSFYREAFLDDHQCNIYLNGGKVIFVQRIFD